MSRISYYKQSPFVDTLIFKAKGLRRPGLPVIYVNPAMPNTTGSGVIIEPPADEEDRELLVWWEGTMMTTPNPNDPFESSMMAFNELVGPELGTADGKSVRVSVPFILDVDFSQVEGRRIALAWIAEQGISTEWTVNDVGSDIEAFCWSVVDLAPCDPEDSEEE